MTDWENIFDEKIINEKIMHKFPKRELLETRFLSLEYVENKINHIFALKRKIVYLYNTNYQMTYHIYVIILSQCKRNGVPFCN